MEQTTSKYGMAGEQSVTQKLRTRMWVERGLFVALAAAGVAYYSLVFRVPPEACVITVNGKPSVVVGSAQTAEHLLSQIKRTAGPIQEVGFAQQVTLQRVSREGASPLSEAEALKALTPQLTLVAPGVGLFVNGRLLYGFADRQQAVGALSLLLKELSPPDPDLTRAFQEKVQLTSARIPVAQFLPSADAALSRVRASLSQKKAHVIRAGDSPWKIANEYGLPIAALKRANPRVDFTRLVAGETVMVPTGVSPLTVIAWKEVEESLGGAASGRTQVVRHVYVNGAVSSRQVVLRPRAAQEEPAPRRRSWRQSRRSHRERAESRRRTTPARRRAVRDSGPREEASRPADGVRITREPEATPSWQESTTTP